MELRVVGEDEEVNFWVIFVHASTDAKEKKDNGKY